MSKGPPCLTRRRRNPARPSLPRQWLGMATWAAPINGVPRFELAIEVKEGSTLYILPFLTNPKLHAAAMPQVR